LKSIFYIFVLTALRKITAILLILVTSAGYSGYQILCTCQIQNAKKQAALKMLRQIPDSFLTKIEIDQPLAYDGEDELWYAGQMFDIVKRVSQNGKEYLFCIADTEEAAALKKMADLVHPGSNSGSNGNTGLKIKSSLPDIFCSNLIDETEKLPVFCVNGSFNNYISPLSRLSRQILKPPPEQYPAVLLKFQPV
jgi:hypothetical protein